MKKLLFTLFTALFALNVAAGITTMSGDCGPNAKWTLYLDDSNYTATLEITGKGEIYDYTTDTPAGIFVADNVITVPS